MNDIRKNVRNVMIVFLFCLISLISYIAYFQVFKSTDIAEKTGNQRLWIERNKVLRGTIYDRYGKPLTKSSKESATTQKREYIYGDLYAHPLGYFSSRYGITGLEEAYDKELTTYNEVTTGIKALLKDFSVEGFKKAFSDRDKTEQKVGNGVVTTLDTNLQQVAYNSLGSNRGAVVAMNPKTGEILAMVSKPSFNPNNLGKELEKANKGTAENSPLINRAINGLYPPGSIFKIVTTTSALDNIPGVKNDIFHDTGVIEFPDGKDLHNDSNAVNGDINLNQAFVKSSNFVYGNLAMELGDDLKETAEDFGFNQKVPANGFTITPSRYPKEKQGMGNLARSGIGQSSILATPMQMALVASAVANNGVIMEPTLVNKVVSAKGDIVKVIKPEEYKKVMSESDATTIKGYMRDLVKSREYGSWSYFRGLDVAGKTGTADHNNPDGTPAKPHSWFVGMAPADNPEIVVAVISENSGYGSGRAASIAGDVINAALR